ncbi:hypothetical protein [Streptomyces sp. NPDC101393]|uniref:hypothetical protein n=1 Tax=Streptomyces sp. NPDC101393 TaxID=3366141 RepID=UPI0037FC0DED
MQAPARGEQERAAAWCGRLLLFAALIAGIVTMHTFGHPMAGHGGHATLTASASASSSPSASASAAASAPVAPATSGPVSAASGPMGMAHPVSTTASGGQAAHPSADPGGGAMDPAAVCLAVLSVWAVALLVLLGAGLPSGDLEADRLAALRTRLARGLRSIPPPPRHKLLARLSVLRV